MPLAWVKGQPDEVVQRRADDPPLPFFQDCEAMVAFRQGRYDEAVNWADKALQCDQPAAQAKASVVKALAQNVLTSKPEANLDDWLPWLHTLVTVREAEALIRGKY